MHIFHRRGCNKIRSRSDLGCTICELFDLLFICLNVCIDLCYFCVNITNHWCFVPTPNQSNIPFGQQYQSVLVASRNVQVGRHGLMVKHLYVMRRMGWNYSLTWNLWIVCTVCKLPTSTVYATINKVLACPVKVIYVVHTVQ